MKPVMLIIISFMLSSSAFAAGDFKWCSVKFNANAHSFMHLLEQGESSAAIITKEYFKEIFVGTATDAQSFIDENAVNAFLIIFHLKSDRNPDLFEVTIAQLVPKSENSSEIKESDIAFGSAASLPLHVGFRLNETDNVNVLCKD